MFDQQGVIAMDDDNAPPTTRKQTRKQRKQARRAAARERYVQRKEAGECQRCRAPVEGDSLWCAEHHATEIEARRVLAKSRRKKLRAAGCCPDCGRPKAGRAGVQNTVVLPAAFASPARWHTEGQRNVVRQVTEGDGRTRNRSSGRGKRGGMGNAANDELDAKLARAEFDRFEQALAILHSPEVKAMGRLERDSTTRAALAHLDLHDRLVEQIRDRLTKRLR